MNDAPALAPAPEETADHPRSSRAVTVLFACTALLGAGLLFVVQPMVAKLILPSYGGSATVWSTSSLFFQVLLLAAYGYAHLSTRRLGRRLQPRAHLVVLLIPVLALPVAIPSDAAPSADASPVLWLLRTLTLVIGLPFLVVATTGPLLQRWYSWGNHRRSDDPYFLFAASNLGSFGGLLAYPFLIEPTMSLDTQRAAWSGAFVLFAALTGACALSVRGRPDRDATGSPGQAPPPPSGRLTRKQVLTWTGLAFLPSSLMLGVTAHISTDIAAIPLLWVVPLAIYLATFVVAFARTTRTPPVRLTRLAVASAVVMLILSLAPGVLPIELAVILDLVMLALVGYAAHARLAAERPPADHLTAFYLVVATGGALGGLLNGMVAPMVFDRVWEYPLALLVVPLLLLGSGISGAAWLHQRVTANKLRAALAGVLVLVTPLGVLTALTLVPRSTLSVVVFVSAVAALAWLIASVPRVLMAGLATALLVSVLAESRGVIEQSRTFFGSYTVGRLDGVHQLVHGTTVHGRQLTRDGGESIPTTYYARTGPLGNAFALRGFRSIAAVGLGIGTVAAYGAPGQLMRFYEIDAEVVRLAEDPTLFTFLADSDADIDVVVGDGRLELTKEPPGSFDLVILDAFSSDSIPVHLLTEEAMAAYAERLTPDGLLMVHISNRVFDLEPVLASSAHRLDLAAAFGHGGASDVGVDSTWVALSRDEASIGELLRRPGWRPLGDERVRWTDDYSSILSVLH